MFREKQYLHKPSFVVILMVLARELNCMSLNQPAKFKVLSHVASAFAFFFDLCRKVLENADVNLKHHHLLP